MMYRLASQIDGQTDDLMPITDHFRNLLLRAVRSAVMTNKHVRLKAMYGDSQLTLLPKLFYYRKRLYDVIAVITSLKAPSF